MSAVASLYPVDPDTALPSTAQVPNIFTAQIAEFKPFTQERMPRLNEPGPLGMRAEHCVCLCVSVCVCLPARRVGAEPAERHRFRVAVHDFLVIMTPPEQHQSNASRPVHPSASVKDSCQFSAAIAEGAMAVNGTQATPLKPLCGIQPQFHREAGTFMVQARDSSTRPLRTSSIRNSVPTETSWSTTSVLNSERSGALLEVRLFPDVTRLDSTRQSTPRCAWALPWKAR